MHPPHRLFVMLCLQCTSWQGAQIKALLLPYAESESDWILPSAACGCELMFPGLEPYLTSHSGSLTRGAEQQMCTFWLCICSLYL